MARYQRLTVGGGVRVSVDADGNIGILGRAFGADDVVILSLGQVQRWRGGRQWWCRKMDEYGVLGERWTYDSRRQAIDSLVARSAWAPKEER